MSRSCTACSGQGKLGAGYECPYCFGLGDVSPKTKLVDDFMKALDDHITEMISYRTSDSDMDNPGRTRAFASQQLAKLLLAGESTS